MINKNGVQQQYNQGTNIRPGDDFLLRLGVVEAPGVAAAAGDGEFVAVYDHKMLWRANLYIDEKKNEDGTWLVANTRICNWGQLRQSEQDTLKGTSKNSYFFRERKK